MGRKSVVNGSTKIGSKLKKIRLDNNMTIAELARNLDISKGHLSSLETGRENPTKELLQKYEMCFAISFGKIDFSQSFSESEIKAFRRLHELLIYLKKDHFEDGSLTAEQQNQLDALNENLASSGLLFLWSEERKEYILADWTSYR